MFARMVTCNVLPDKKQTFTTTLRDQVLNTLKNQKGFIDLVGLFSETDPNKAVAISIWNTREDADRYMRTDYPRVLDTIRPMITGTPTLSTFNVDTSTFHKIAAGKAA